MNVAPAPIMSSETKCPKCGASRSANAAKGLCPRCLLAAGVEAAEKKLAEGKRPGAEDGVSEQIGRYRILQKLGEGGYGVVYMAVQTEPVNRRVALKIIKLGMDTRQVIARFQAERQTLALMDHPSIAKVLDAGTTDNGRPYFVMELVKGIRITDYCDQHHLGIPERLRLFMQVCQAIQHAHQKGVIHRDIKPSNIMVVLHDREPAPKVIDFGIAKATEQPWTDKSLFTVFGQFMGTPAYMSPEQAELNGLDIDTRSDIYALGVLLYELVTGRTPFDGKELSQAGLDELRRRIREEEPMRPSVRLAAMDSADLAQVSAQRRSDSVKLPRTVRGDLDWIVMKCLEKDRTRRYETANALAMDIRRHLGNEPVEASPPSSMYRLKKMVRRNRVAVIGTVAVILALLMGFGLSTWMWWRTRESEKSMQNMANFFRRTHITRTERPREYNLWARSTNEVQYLVLPGDPLLKGKTHAQWAAAMWRWGMEYPLTNSAGVVHPWLISDRFDVSAYQSGDVWFLGAPIHTNQTPVRRSCVIPPGKALFVSVFSVESSNLEEAPYHGDNADDQEMVAQYWADHIVNLYCEIDHVRFSNMAAFRVLNPQITFNAPAPWLFGEKGGRGTSRGDGYYVFLSPLPPGRHVLKFGGTMLFTKEKDTVALPTAYSDIVYEITVLGKQDFESQVSNNPE